MLYLETLVFCRTAHGASPAGTEAQQELSSLRRKEKPAPDGPAAKPAQMALAPGLGIKCGWLSQDPVTAAGDPAQH